MAVKGEWFWCNSWLLNMYRWKQALYLGRSAVKWAHSTPMGFSMPVFKLSLIIPSCLILNWWQTLIGLALWMVLYLWQSHSFSCGILGWERNVERNFSRAHSSQQRGAIFGGKLSLRRLRNASLIYYSHFHISNFSSTTVIVQVLCIFFIDFINQQLLFVLWMNSVKCLAVWSVQGQGLMNSKLNGV